MVQISMVTSVGGSVIMSVAVPIGNFIPCCINALLSNKKNYHSIRQRLHAKSILEARRLNQRGPVFIRLAMSKTGPADIIQT